MPGFLDIQVTSRKNGQVMPWFKDTLGRRIGTSMGVRAAALSGNRAVITDAEQMAWLANYWIELLQEQLDAGIGSDGAPMPPLKSTRRRRWSQKQQRRVEYGVVYAGYALDKQNAGIEPIRNLWGPGNSITYQKQFSRKAQSLLSRWGLSAPKSKSVTLAAGHMRNDIRTIYVDDRMAKIGITTQASRIKALANERKAAWWGLSPESARRFAQAQATIYGGAVEDWLDSLGLVQAGNYMVQVARALNRRHGNPLWSMVRRVRQAA